MGAYIFFKIPGNIHYAYADITKLGSIPFDVQFDAITTFVVFMHFDTKKQIYHALKNIYNSLKKDGLFLWYDVNVKSHWDTIYPAFKSACIGLMYNFDSAIG